MNTNCATDTVVSPMAAFPPTAPRDKLPLQIFSTCPSSTTAPENYRGRVVDVARWSERAGCTGILIYTDNSIVDPWMVSQIILQNTQSLCPLVAVQPVYMHPYSVAKMVATAAWLHGRRMFLNMVAGGFKNDLLALGDDTPHDCRYERLVEYTAIIRRLLDAAEPVTFEGRFYRTNNLTLSPRVPSELRPGIVVSGSSEAGLAAAREMGATPIQYPGPLDDSQTKRPSAGGSWGVRIGIVTRSSDEAAWKEAHSRFPEDRKGQLTRQLAAKTSDSIWHHRLADAGKVARGSQSIYWLHPFENYQTNCPYLVGSYDNVAEELMKYLDLGCDTFILDIPPTEEELDHIGCVFQAASKRVLA